MARKKKADDAHDNAWSINPQTGRTRTAMNPTTFDKRGSFSAPPAETWGADSMSNTGRAGDPRPRGGPAPRTPDTPEG